MRGLAIAEKSQLEAFSGRIAALAKASDEKLDGIRTESGTRSRQLREEIVGALKGITATTTKAMGDLANLQKTKLGAMSFAIGKLSDSNEKKLEAMGVRVEGKLQGIQADNAKQLDQMRRRVDEKLQEALEKRLGGAFKQVDERLEIVHKKLGEMQSIATGVGDLKKMLMNLKTRETWHEVKLGELLEKMLNPTQFATNVATKDGGDRVEFAVKLPGQDSDKDETVWLPIDAKFPIEDYQRLIEAEEKADVEGVRVAGKQLENRLKAYARDISGRYLNPPKTADFCILFLPIEGLFLEVIRRTDLTEAVQRECCFIAGPTTLRSILSSLQMGLRTVAIQKRPSAVWNLLAAVKTKWTNYGNVLNTVQKKLHQASGTIEKAEVRPSAVARKLQDMPELPVSEANTLPPLNEPEDDRWAGGNDDEAGNELQRHRIPGVIE
jgi:DNA recombination protein RmuC